MPYDITKKHSISHHADRLCTLALLSSQYELVLVSLYLGVGNPKEARLVVSHTGLWKGKVRQGAQHGGAPQHWGS